ncbi:MAG: hypothetical protein KJ626_02645 [Verrucomicrobia bacterium]|nr:hypothetical protein [Verrucomicrobiota bacterium]
MRKLSFQEALEQIVQEDPRYDEQAYHFLREALDHTVKLLSKPVEGPGKHVSGAELVNGIRQYALKEFGPLAKTVLNSWGITETGDWGDIVFNLVKKGVLGKTEDDRKEDFQGAYDFDEAFVKPFLPVGKKRRDSAESKK